MITATWQGAGNWTHPFTTTTAAMPGTTTLGLTLIPGTTPSGVLLDTIAWQHPVELNMQRQGAAFLSDASPWHYTLTNLAADATLYNVTDEQIPQRLILPPGNPTFLAAEPQHYILSGAGTLHTPTITAHTPVDLAQPLNADVVYIAPAALHAALAPLVAHRQAQGYTVAVVDVQAIYAAWSYGQVAPTAIRAFLRYAAAHWQSAPRAVTLVGDGTSDPRNYTRHNHTTWLPPYLATVDPWLGETACDTCYAQLDGDDPLSDGLPDVALGRLPVKNSQELAALVAKLIRYETAPAGGPWRERAIYIADNYQEASGATDASGNFAALADANAALLPQHMTVERIYYDPAPTHIGVPWREPNAPRAHRRTMAALQAGAGLVTYIGHGHYWQWGVTDPQADPPYLLGLYDADDLTNGGRIPIVLSMTCLTSAFHQPSFSGTTIDERLLLHANGGAVAVWGPTGLGVVHGHDMLQRGFHTALRADPAASPTLGNLTLAGYATLFTQGACCQDALRTFALLGDPLTPARLSATAHTYLPVLQR